MGNEKTIQKWEEDFDEKFPTSADYAEVNYKNEWSVGGNEEIKHFISQLLEKRDKEILGMYNCQHGGRECNFQTNCHRLIEEELDKEKINKEFDELPCLHLPQAHKKRIKQFFHEKMMENNYDKFLNYYYNSPCPGCPGGHSSFWKSIIESPEWKEWKKVGQRDFSECEELGICSSDHWKEFVEFIKEN